MKTIRQLSDELGISKEAVYKKLRYQLKNELTGHVTKVDNVTHVDDEGEQIIRQSLGCERREAIHGILEGGDEPVSQPHVNEYIRLLEDQVKTKDTQLETQNNHIGLLIRQLGNSHMLSRAERLGGLLSAGAPPAPVAAPKKKRRPLWRRLVRH